MPKINRLVFSVTFFINTLCLVKLENVVSTESGKILGKVSVDRKGNTYYSFQSIPFAKPPVGDLRFKDPEPVQPWSTILNGTQPPPVCVQGNYNSDPSKMQGDEDCLYLNVFTPNISNANNSLLPVMVYIHGGAYRVGSSHEHASPDYLLPEKIVLATINYRLGFFGFLNMANNSLGVPGNAALKDKVLALKWIKNNIKYFGGNPDSITIFGESAGAGSVHLLVLSPMAKGLFHRAIAQSGSALNLWVDGKRDNGKTLGRVLNISTNDEKELLTQLRRVPASTLYEAQFQIMPDANISVQWDASVIVEYETNAPAFLPDKPINLLRSAKYNDVPFMIGYNSQEGILNQVVKWWNNKTLHFITNFEKYLPYVLKNERANVAEIAEKVRQFYYRNYTNDNIQPSIDYVTDTWFYYDIYQSALEHSKISKSSVYFYKFSADTKLNFFKRFVPPLATHPGASHVDDLGYMFKIMDVVPKIEPGSIEDISIDRVVKLWTNFAKYGNPTPIKESLFNNQTWEPLLPNSTQVFEIDNNFKTSANINFEPINFWNDIYGNYTNYL